MHLPPTPNPMPLTTSSSFPPSLLLRSTLFLLPWLLKLLLADIFLSLLLPLSLLFPNQSYDLASHIASEIWTALQTIFTHNNGAHIILSGGSLPRNGESAIVVSNHVAWADTYLVQELALQAGMLGRCRWFAKRGLRWVPFLGWGLWAMGMPLVSREWTLDRGEMERVFGGVGGRGWSMWLIAYSESTRYTAAKRMEAEAWCRAHGKRLGKHVLYPRTKGFIACVQRLRRSGNVKAVYDLTIAYAKHGKEFQSPPSFSETLVLPRLSETWQFFVHVERYPLADLPETDEELAQWLEDRWVEKGERLEVLKQRLGKGLSWDPKAMQNGSLEAFSSSLSDP